jgi:cytochrome c5
MSMNEPVRPARWLRAGLLAIAALSLTLIAACDRGAPPAPEADRNAEERTAPMGEARVPPAEEPAAPPVAEAPPPAEPAAPAPAPEAAPPAAAPAEADLAAGKAVYDKFCIACHATGAADAPLLGNAAAWQPRIEKGMDVMVQNSITGIGAMPPRGTCFQCSDDELRAAVQFMVSQVQ